jgi:hypothetical protein
LPFILADDEAAYYKEIERSDARHPYLLWTDKHNISGVVSRPVYQLSLIF